MWTSWWPHPSESELDTILAIELTANGVFHWVADHTLTQLALKHGGVVKKQLRWIAFWVDRHGNNQQIA